MSERGQRVTPTPAAQNERRCGPDSGHGGQCLTLDPSFASSLTTAAAPPRFKHARARVRTAERRPRHGCATWWSPRRTSTLSRCWTSFRPAACRRSGRSCWRSSGDTGRRTLWRSACVFDSRQARRGRREVPKAGAGCVQPAWLSCLRMHAKQCHPNAPFYHRIAHPSTPCPPTETAGAEQTLCGATTRAAVPDVIVAVQGGVGALRRIPGGSEAGRGLLRSRLRRIHAGARACTAASAGAAARRTRRTWLGRCRCSGGGQGRRRCCAAVGRVARCCNGPGPLSCSGRGTRRYLHGSAGGARVVVLRAALRP